MKKFASIALVFALILGGTGVAYKQWQTAKLAGPVAPETTSLEEILEEVAPDAEPEEVAAEPDESTNEPAPQLPSSLNIEMPFFTQAPHANWDYPWQEACEEASVLLVANLFNNMNLGLEAYNQALLELVDWEMETFGAYEHTTVAQTAQMLTQNFGLEARIHEDPTFEDIQEILASGNLIIAPFAGKLLENPNFKNGGPPYHMSVIKGYDANKMQIVTHDVGTRNGANYVYSWETIETALHNWHDDDILLGDRLIIEVLAP